MNEQISDNFNMSEFVSKDGSEMPLCVAENIRELVRTVLQLLRDRVNVPIIITDHGGYRSPVWNRKKGGVRNSQHMYGRAADIKIKGMTPRQVADLIQEMFDPPGLGRYRSFTHVDIRTGRKARWGKN